MSKPRSRWYLISVILAVSAFLAAFGIALAATVQVSRQIPSTLSVESVTVIPDENLVISHDEEGNDPVTSFNITMFDFQPPLDICCVNTPIFIRNDSDIDLTIVEPCGGIDTATGERIEFMQVERDDGIDGKACDGDFVIAPGETVESRFHLNKGDDIPPGTYEFTAVIGAVGEQE